MDIAWLDDPAMRLMLRASFVCVLLGISGGLLGCVLMARRMTLMADALSHSLLPGIGAAFLLVGPSVGALLLGGLGAGLATALLAGVLSRHTRLQEDAAFAGMFSGMLALGVILVSQTGGSTELHHILFGQLLAVTHIDVIMAGGTAIATIATFTLGYRAILLECFDPEFHRACGGKGTFVHLGLLTLVVVVLVTALHALGTMLALGLFTLPAVTAYLWCERWHYLLLTSAALGILGSIGGMLISMSTGLPSGACVVCCLGGLFVISGVVAPHGMIVRRLRPIHHEHEHSSETCDL